MYSLLDKPSAVKDIQKYLHTISDKINSDIRRVEIDGIYGYETKMAVSDFQAAYGLEVNGLVDLITFELLFDMYTDAVAAARIRDYIISDIGFPIKIGMQGRDIITVHSMIKELQKTYTDIENIIESAYFSARSARAVRNLQRIFMLEETGEIDEYLFERFLMEIESIRRLNEDYI